MQNGGKEKNTRWEPDVTDKPLSMHHSSLKTKKTKKIAECHAEGNRKLHLHSFESLALMTW